MKNPLLVPELREMLRAHRVDEIRDFASFTPPESTAEFLSALEPEEGRNILEMLEPEMRSLVFVALEDEARLAILNLIDENDAVAIVQGIPEDVREGFLERLPLEHQQRLREKVKRAHTEEAAPLLVAIEEALAPEPEKLEELTPEEIANEVNQHLETYRFVAGRTERLTRPERGCWVRIVNPSRENLPLIAEHFKVPIDFLTAALDLDETARIEIDDQATLFIIKIPYYDEDSKSDVLYFTIPVGIILVGGMILTVCTRQSTVLQEFADSKVRHIGGGHRFILQLIMRAAVRYLTYLKQLNNAANIIQKKLEMESRNKQLIKLFNIEKSLVYFTTSLKSNQLMLERLRRMNLLEMNEQNENLLEDIFTETKQSIEMANIYSSILSGMMGAFSSVISNNLNIVMRLLTSITIIITIPVLVASFYGMNVRLPLAEHRYAFLFIIGLSFVLSSAAVFYFVRRRWLEP
jgi:magnesium transporter